MTLTDAINILKNERPHCGRKIRYTEGDICEAFDMAIKALEQQPKTGHWIGGDGNYICSCCKCNPDDFLEPLGLDGGSYMSVPMKYCPNCGAKMVDPQESEE